MTYEKKSVIELREIAKERKIKGISTLKKKELIETLEKYDQENYKEVKSKEETHGEHQGRKHYHTSVFLAQYSIIYVSDETFLYNM